MWPPLRPEKDFVHYSATGGLGIDHPRIGHPLGAHDPVNGVAPGAALLPSFSAEGAIRLERTPMGEGWGGGDGGLRSLSHRWATSDYGDCSDC